MIGPHDRLRLPAGVELRERALHDEVRTEVVPVNAAALVVLASETPAAAAEDLERHAGARGRALADVLGFCAQLNERRLLNVDVRGGPAGVAWRWLKRAPLLLPLGVAPRAPTRRRRLDTSDARAAVRSGMCALAAHTASLALVGGLGTASLLVILDAWSLGLAASIGLGLAAAVLVHELGHAAALIGVPACVVTRSLRCAVVHHVVSPRRTRVVAACGPCAGLALASTLVVCLHARPGTSLAAATTVALTNTVGLTVAARDGRTLCGLR